MRDALRLCLAGLTFAVMAHSAAAQKPRDAGGPIISPADGGFLIGYDQRPAVQAFIDDVVIRDGFSREELLRLFAGTRFNDTVVRLINPSSPTRPRAWHEYEARLVEPVRLKAGVRFWQAHAADLNRAVAEYGVPPEIIVGILGVETVYGRNMGRFRVIDALTTLAFDYPQDAPDRSAFFKSQLEDLLLFARQTQQDLFAIKGSYAGAIGMPQFMPESYLKYAVDFDADGQIDLAGSPSDAIGSVANFLAQHGWHRDLPVMYRATLTERADPIALAELAVRGSEPSAVAADLRSAGLALPDGIAPTLPLSLIDLPNADGPTDYVAGTSNFHVLTRYNRSYFYAMAVLELGQAVAARVVAESSPAPTADQHPNIGKTPASPAEAASPGPTQGIQLMPTDSLQPRAPAESGLTPGPEEATVPARRITDH